MEHEQHDGLRALIPPLPGVRPGSLFDPGPQRSDRTVRHSAGDTPLLVVPALRGHDGVDGTTLRFLLEQNLSLKKKQEEEEKERKWREQRKVMKAEFMALMALPSLTPLQASRSQELVVEMAAHDASKPSSGSSKRKKKKRKRRKLPKAPLPRSGAVLGQGRCAGVAQRQGHGQIVQNTVLVPQLQFIEGRLPPFVPQKQIPMVLPVQITMRLRSCSLSGGRCPCCAGRAMPVVVLTGAHGSDTAEYCGGAAVAARRFLGPGRRHLCRGAETDSHGLTR